MAKIVAHAHEQLVLTEPACIVANHPLLFRQLIIEEQRIAPVENGVCHTDCLQS